MYRRAVDRRTHRAPSLTLAAAIAAAAAVTLPVLALHAAVVLSRRTPDFAAALGEVLLASGPVVVGYAVAAAMWLAARRSGSTRQAWLLAAAGTAVVVAVSYQPLDAVVALFVAEWRETQPGGRGYYPG